VCAEAVARDNCLCPPRQTIAFSSPHFNRRSLLHCVFTNLYPLPQKPADPIPNSTTQTTSTYVPGPGCSQPSQAPCLLAGGATLNCVRVACEVDTVNLYVQASQDMGSGNSAAATAGSDFGMTQFLAPEDSASYGSSSDDDCSSDDDGDDDLVTDDMFMTMQPKKKAAPVQVSGGYFHVLFVFSRSHIRKLCTGWRDSQSTKSVRRLILCVCLH